MSQTPQPIPQPAHEEKRAFRYAFARSTWITSGWNWFLMLAGKAAEPVLTVSVIYSCARLLPAIHMPVQLDNSIFICQMIALDIGGLGLRKLANQARRDNNEAGATLAGRVSTALLTIMGVNVALSVLESIAPLDPIFTKVVEGILLIARAVMAVLYAYVIHSLHGEQETDVPSVPVPPLDIEALTEAITRRVEAASEARFAAQVRQLTASNEARLEAILRQRVVVSEAPTTPQREAPKPARREAKKPEQEAGSKVLPLRQPGAVLPEKRLMVYRLAEQDANLSSYAIAERTGIPVSTVQRYLKDWKERRHEAAREANGTEP